MESEYFIEHIRIIDRDSIRKRPGMFLGDTGVRGLANLVLEAFNWALDRVVHGPGGEIEVTLLPGGGYRVADNGTPLPTGEALNLMELLILNALTQRLDVEVRCASGHWLHSFSRGHSTEPPKRLGDASGQGTTLTFWPDPEIFGAVAPDQSLLDRRALELASFYPGLRLRVDDQRPDFQARADYLQLNGVAGDLFPHQQTENRLLSQAVLCGDIETEEGRGSVALNWDKVHPGLVSSYANTMRTTGGEHERGFVQGIIDGLSVLPDMQELTERANRKRIPLPPIVRASLRAILHVEVRDPQFNSPTREILGNMEAFRLMRVLGARLMGELIANHPADADAVVSHFLQANCDAKSGEF